MNRYDNKQLADVINQLTTNLDEFTDMDDQEIIDSIANNKQYIFIKTLRDELVNNHGFLKWKANELVIEADIEIEEDCGVSGSDIIKAAEDFAKLVKKIHTVVNRVDKLSNDDLITMAMKRGVDISFSLKG